MMFICVDFRVNQRNLLDNQLGTCIIYLNDLLDELKGVHCKHVFVLVISVYSCLLALRQEMPLETLRINLVITD